MEAVRFDSLLLQELGHLLGAPPRRAVHDRAAGCLRRQMMGQRRVDVLVLGGLRCRDHDEVQVGAAAAAVEHRHVDSQVPLEVVADLGLDLWFGCRGQAQHRRCALAAGSLADEPPHIAVVGTEVVSPLGQAVGLVEHPGADLALLQRAANRHAAELFGGDQQDRGVAEPHLLERLGPLRHRQQPVDGDTGRDAVTLEACRLIGHERHQRRQHHSQRARVVIARQRGYLVAQRLACARRQNRQHISAPHRRLDDRLLHRLARLGFSGFWPERLKPEQSLEFRSGVVVGAAPLAALLAAGLVAQAPHEPPSRRELMPHPGRHHRVASRHRQPRQRVCQRPAMLGGVRYRPAHLRLT